MICCGRADGHELGREGAIVDEQANLAERTRGGIVESVQCYRIEPMMGGRCCARQLG